MAKIGDTVRFLNTTGGGKITKIEGKMAYVDEDGFETPVLLNGGGGGASRRTRTRGEGRTHDVRPESV